MSPPADTPIAATVVTDRGPATALQPVAIVPMSPVAIVAVRTLRTYLQAVLGLFVAAAIAQTASPLQLAGGILGALELAAIAGVAPAIVALLQNAVELLAAIDATNPKLRG